MRSWGFQTAPIASLGCEIGVSMLCGVSQRRLKNRICSTRWDEVDDILVSLQATCKTLQAFQQERSVNRQVVSTVHLTFVLTARSRTSMYNKAKTNATTYRNTWLFSCCQAKAASERIDDVEGEEDRVTTTPIALKDEKDSKAKFHLEIVLLVEIERRHFPRNTKRKDFGTIRNRFG